MCHGSVLVVLWSSDPRISGSSPAGAPAQRGAGNKCGGGAGEARAFKVSGQSEKGRPMTRLKEQKGQKQSGRKNARGSGGKLAAAAPNRGAPKKTSGAAAAPNRRTPKKTSGAAAARNRGALGKPSGAAGAAAAPKRGGTLGTAAGLRLLCPWAGHRSCRRNRQRADMI